MKVSDGPFLETTGLNTVTDNPDSVIEMVTAAVGDEPIQLSTDLSSLHLSQDPYQQKVSPETEKWSNFTGSEMKQFLDLIIFRGQVKLTI